jgi:hypothetical protein
MPGTQPVSSNISLAVSRRALTYGFYPVTERFTISANGVVGSTNTSADIAFVPPHGPDPVPSPIAVLACPA